MQVYKTLFEIKLEHEYFLTKEDGTNLFSEPDPANRKDLLEAAYQVEREAMHRDIDFQFPTELATTYNNYGLKVLPTYSGCRVAVRVNKQTLSDNSLVFEPFYALPDSLDIIILFVKKNIFPDLYTNEKIRRSIPSTYLFSNENINGSKVFPFLVNTISGFDSGYFYEQGELAIDSSNTLQETYYDNSGTLQLKPVNSGVQLFANENDRLLVPSVFNYYVINNSQVTQLNIDLKDQSSNVIKSFAFSRSEPISKIQLDFRDIIETIQLSEKISLPNGIYSLEVAGNNSYSETKRIVFSNSFYSIYNWGAAYIKVKSSNNAFDLIANDGFILKRRDPLGVWTEAPVYEVPIKSRFGYFRYINSNGKELKLNPILNNYLFKESKILISQVPVSLCKYYFLIPDNGGVNTKFLPNPDDYEIKIDNFRRICFDVIVPESDLFPVVP